MKTARLWESEEERWMDAFRDALGGWDGDSIEHVIIHMSNESPTLFVNVDDDDDPSEDARLEVEIEDTFLSDLEEGQGFFLSMDLLTLKKSMKRFMEDAWSVDTSTNTDAELLRRQVLRESPYWDEDEDAIEEGMEEAALADPTGAANLAEVVWVYRLALLLGQELDEVEVSAVVHDAFDETHRGLWKLAVQYRDQPLSSYLAVFGLLQT